MIKVAQQIRAIEQIVIALLNLRWRRIGDKISTGGFPNKQVQSFEFLKAGGAVTCVVEFEHTEYYEGPGPGSIWGRSGKIYDSNRIVVVEERDLVNVDAKPYEHPLNDLHDVVWGRESGEPILQNDKFPETLKLERFARELRT